VPGIIGKLGARLLLSINEQLLVHRNLIILTHGCVMLVQDDCSLSMHLSSSHSESVRFVVE